MNESDVSLKNVIELLKDAIENIEGLESLRDPQEKRYRPESLARYDVGKAISILEAQNPEGPREEIRRIIEVHSPCIAEANDGYLSRLWAERFPNFPGKQSCSIIQELEKAIAQKPTENKPA